MKNYLGVKIVEAEPMGEVSFINNVKNEDVTQNCLCRDGYKVTYEDGYVSWSPKNVFEKAYRQIDGLTFGLAIEALKQGKKVARTGWNGKGMYLTLVQGYPVNGHLNPAGLRKDEESKLSCKADDLYEFCVSEINPDDSQNIIQGNPGQMLSHIVMKTSGDSQFWGLGYSDYVPWLASQTDILAEDWMIVE